MELCMLVSPIDRRRLLRQGVLAGAALPLLSLWPAGRAAAEIEPVPRRVFFDNPDIGSVSVSPDGWTLAWLAPVDGVRNLFVARIDDLNSARPVTRVTDRNLAPFYRWAHTNRHIVFFQERDGDENWRASSVDIRSGAIVPLSPPQGVRSFIQEIDRKFPTDMLIRHNQRDKRFFDLYRVNILNGASDLLYENTEYTGLLTDGDFQLRLGVRFAKDGSAEVLERHASGSWSPFATVPVGDVDGMRLLDFSPDGHTLYFIDARGRDKAALFAMDMATRKTTLLAADEEADIVGVNFFSRRPVAAMSYRERARWHAVDASMVQDLADLGASSGGGDIEILGRTYGNRIVTAYFEHDTASGEYALLDRETHEVRPLFKQRTALAGVALQKLEPVVIPARDGLRLNGYLTRPVDAPPGKAPMVLVIHGGPLCPRRVGLQSHPSVACQPRLCGAQRQLPGLDRLRQGVRHRRRPRMGRTHARRSHRRGRLGGGAGHRRSRARRLLWRELWRLFGADGGDEDAGQVCLHRRPLRHLQLKDVHGDHSVVLGAVVQHLEAAARRSRDRGRPRLPHRALAAHPHRPRDAADPDRARAEGRAGGGGGIRADGRGAEIARRAGDLCHFQRRGPRLRAAGQSPRVLRGRRGFSRQASRRPHPAGRRRFQGLDAQG
jgi:hypothetical protein